MTRERSSGIHGRKGSTLIEFALSALLLFTLLFAFVEFGRFLLVYNSVANAARAGVRYAIVHACITDLACPLGPDPSEAVRAVVENYARAAPIDLDRLTVNVEQFQQFVGGTVRIRVTYSYDPLISIFPLAVNLSTVSEGAVAF